MGVGFSSLVDNEKIASDGCSSKSGLGDLPESCIALILLHLNPTEICKFARLNRTFRRASFTDVVWGLKLPDNYQVLVKKVFEEEEEDHESCPDQSLTKKDIYARLCRPNHFGGSKNKEFWLEKNGGVCVCMSWKEMKITGIDDRRYWSHISSDESRFNTVAFLKQIWWVEVEGNLEFEFPAGNYSLFLRLQLGRSCRIRLGRRACNVEQVHGWDIKPVQFQLTSSNGQQVTTQCYLNEPGKWIQYHVGDFVVHNSNVPTRLKFSMTQIDCTHTKGGLCLDSVFIFPAQIGPNRKIQLVG